MADDEVAVSLQEILAEMDDAGMTKFKLAQQIALNKKLVQKVSDIRNESGTSDAK